MFESLLMKMTAAKPYITGVPAAVAAGLTYESCAISGSNVFSALFFAGCAAVFLGTMIWLLQLLTHTTLEVAYVRANEVSGRVSDRVAFRVLGVIVALSVVASACALKTEFLLPWHSLRTTAYPLILWWAIMVAWIALNLQVILLGAFLKVCAIITVRTRITPA